MWALISNISFNNFWDLFVARSRGPFGAMVAPLPICAFGANIRGCCFVLNNQLFDEEMLCKCFDKCSKALAINTG